MSNDDLLSLNIDDLEIEQHQQERGKHFGRRWSLGKRETVEKEIRKSPKRVETEPILPTPIPNNLPQTEVSVISQNPHALKAGGREGSDNSVVVLINSAN